MSRLRTLLQSLASLGITADQIAEGVPMPLKAVADSLAHDWPVKPRFRLGLETLGYRVLLRAHRAGSPERKREIEAVFFQVFGRSIQSTPLIDCETQRAAYVLGLLTIPVAEVFPIEVGADADDNLHLVWFVHQRLEVLCHESHALDTANPDVVGYLRTLNHAIAVMAGTEDPADNGWDKNTQGYRRGCLIEPKVSERKESD